MNEYTVWFAVVVATGLAYIVKYVCRHLEIMKHGYPPGDLEGVKEDLE